MIHPLKVKAVVPTGAAKQLKHCTADDRFRLRSSDAVWRIDMAEGMAITDSLPRVCIKSTKGASKWVCWDVSVTLVK